MRTISYPSNVNDDRRIGFSLVELLVVIGILGLLIAILLPALNQARHQARRMACARNLRQVGVAIHLYAEDFGDTIPFGPAGRPVTGSNFYTVTGNVPGKNPNESPTGGQQHLVRCRTRDYCFQQERHFDGEHRHVPIRCARTNPHHVRTGR